MLIAFSAAAKANERNSEDSLTFDIPRQRADLALIEFAGQADLTLVFPYDVVRKKTANRLIGTYRLQEGIDVLLSGTGLKPTFKNGVVLNIAEQTQATSEKGRPMTNKRKAGLGALATTLISLGAGAQEVSNDDSDLLEDRLADEIVVTGTRLQLNAGDLSKQTFVITAADLADMGETTLEGALRRIPQNFGGVSPSSVQFLSTQLPGSRREPNGIRDTSGASTINLRGIDGGDRSSGTLVLIDGRRLGQSGIQGGIQDISSIPASRVERVEVVLDGASAIYGSDAIGGVVNIILKKDQHFSMWGNYLDSTENFGDLGEWQLGFNGGFAWDGGDLSFGLSTRQSGEVLGRDIGFRSYNINAYDFNTGEPRPESNIDATSPPSSFNDQSHNSASYLHQINNNYNPTLADFAPGVGSGDNSFSDASILPDVEQYNFDVAFRQSLSDRVEFEAGLIGLTRETLSKSGAAFITTGRRPLLENVFGEDQRGLWGLYPAFGIPESRVKTRSLELYSNLIVDLSDTWDVTFGLSHSNNDTDQVSPVSVIQASTAASLTGWNPFGDGLANANIPYVDDFDGSSGPLQPGEWTDSTGAIYTGSILDFLQQEGPWAVSDNKQNTASLLLRGDLMNLPGGTVRMVLGGEYRDNSLDTVTYSREGFATTITPNYNNLQGDSNHTAAYAEFFVPIVGSENAVPGIQSLSLQGAVRYEDIEHKGVGELSGGTPLEEFSNTYDATTYSVGLVWSPAEAVNLKANFNTSFKAPELLDLYLPELRRPISDAQCRSAVERFGGPTGYCPNIGDYLRHPDPNEWWQPFPYTRVVGGNENLDPERSENWSATLEVRPVDSLLLSATWSRREFIDKVLSAGQLVSALRENAHEQLPQAFVFEPGTDYVIDWNANKINADSNLVEGLDFVADWSLDTGIGNFNVKAGWTVALTNTTRVGEVSDETEAVGIDSPRESGQLTLGWSKGNWRITTDTSYRGATVGSTWYRGNNVRGPETGIRAESWTQTNVKASYNFADTGGWLSGTTLGIGINNAGKQFQKQNFYFEGERIGRIDANAAGSTVRPRTIFIELRKEF